MKKIQNSKGVNEENSYGVNESYGVNWSRGVDESDGLNWSRGVNGSRGVNWSYGILNSFGVDKEIFCADKVRTFHIFGKEVLGARFDEVWKNIYSKSDNWYPKFNNAFELYLKNGSDWSKVDAKQIVSTLSNNSKPYEAWKDMPKKLKEYIYSLPEFDPIIFEKVTGLKSENDKKQALLCKAYELIKKAEELKQEAEKL